MSKIAIHYPRKDDEQAIKAYQVAANQNATLIEPRPLHLEILV